MKIKRLKLENFRSYREEITVDFEDLNVFVGRNDIGKSTIMEALDIFFNEGSGVVKIDKDDVNAFARQDGDLETKISIQFTNLPDSIQLDATNPTTLKDEFLLIEDGVMEVKKVFKDGGKPKVYIHAKHPAHETFKCLLLEKNTGLKKLVRDNNIPCENKTINAVMRKAIWSHFEEELSMDATDIEISKFGDGKDSWGQIKKHMPLYYLFRADRQNNESDDEIQNPMSFAVKEIFQEDDIKELLQRVAERVNERLETVVGGTLSMINEMNPDIASSLKPDIPAVEDIRWESVFRRFGIKGDNDIPINKRGSGVKRMVLINFFRAEAKRKLDAENVPSVIYAIEEPETAQHPDMQRRLIAALKELSTAPNTQVLITTHSPVVVKELDFDCLKLIVSGPNKYIGKVDARELPYPSINEINYLAFGEADVEYHNELYGYIEANQRLMRMFNRTRDKVDYDFYDNKEKKHQHWKITKSAVIRHMIHHPENDLMPDVTREELKASIKDMREFIAWEKGAPLAEIGVN